MFLESLFRKVDTLKSKETEKTVTVVTVTPDKFKQIIANNKDVNEVTVKMSHWVETSGKEAIRNLGAGPCTIIYVLDKTTGKMISGHFPELLEERNTHFSRMDLEYVQKTYPPLNNHEPPSIQIPTEKEAHRLSYLQKDESYENFISMMVQIKTRIEQLGESQLEVFLFGQNNLAFGRTPAEYAQMLIDSMIEQHDVSALFNKLGISYSHIHDHRVPGERNVDNTFFSAHDKILYHSIRDHEEDGMLWLKKK